MIEKNFVHLHVHTEYSLLDGAARIGDLLDAAKNFGMNAIAITDHGTMYGVVNFYKAAVERGIKPIIGCEVYVSAAPIDELETYDGKKYFHLVLLAENNDGYKNLVKIASHAATDGFNYRPRVDRNFLRQHHDGLIALSACVAGEIPRAIRHDDFEHARELIADYVDIFGQGNFFLEIQNHGLDDEAKVRYALKKFSAEFNIPLVATNDSHYIRREDAAFHDVLLCVGTGKKIDDTNRLKFQSDEFYLRSAEEMRELFADVPEACDNTLKIAERCNVTLEFGKFLMPEFTLPDDRDAADYLRELCNKKIRDRYAVITDAVKERLNHELEIIHGMGYDGYFLIVHDFIDFARRKKIPVGPGRGSAAGSIVAYILGITELDPLKYGLLFERFLNPERVTLPDIDVDLCYVRRDEVINYVRERYGADKVSQIATFGTMAAKAAIRDVARVLNVSFNDSSELVRKIPNLPNITLDEALKMSNDLREDYANNPDTRRVIDFARKLEGLPRHTSVHAAGVVISKIPLNEIVPLQISNGTLITQFDKDAVEELGLLKMDFLGLRTLTVIAETFANIKASRGIELDASQIPLRDEKTSAMLTAGDTGAVFQMESAGMTALVKELRPECFEDLIPTVALYRPGPLGSGMVDNFIRIRNLELGIRNEQDNSTFHIPNSSLKCLHPKLEPILRETFGVILYQEQVMQIVQTLAGFTLGQADILRRAMGKKKASILMAQKENFLRGCEVNGVEKSLAEKIFDLLSHFADYGFNKSHSAAYGLLAWQTAYLKAHYPAEYMAAMMSAANDPYKIANYIDIARRLGVKVLPPDVNVGEAHFTVDGDTIRIGLACVKSLGESALDSIITERRRGGKFKSPIDFCGRLDPKSVSRRCVENLIKCGAFDSLDNRRKALFDAVNSMSTVGSNRSRERAHGAISLFDSDELDRANMIIPDAKENWTKRALLQNEKETLGFYLSGHPLNEFRVQMSGLKSSRDIDEKFLGKRVKVGGVVAEFRKFSTKNGELMATITLEDFVGTVNVTLFPNVYKSFEKIAKKNEVVVVTGRVDTADDSFQIVAEKCIKADDYTPDFWLMIPAQIDTPETLDALKKILDGTNPGDGQIYLNQRGTWRKISKKVVFGPEMFKQIKTLLGEENIRLY